MADPADLDDDVRALYAGDPKDFVKARDALAKQLRADGRKDEAAEVKKLRKPERVAGMLDRAAAADPGALDRLVEAATAAAEAQEGGGDVRAATTALRDAVRVLAAATDDPPAATSALVAVVADPEALDALRAGRLVEVPETGGFGPLPTVERPAPEKPKQDEAAERRRREKVEAAVAKARETRDAAAEEHEAAVAAERRAAARLEKAEAALAEAEAALDAL